ncbi:MAG: hypothetical protein CAK90_04475 [Spartobacteria bacterium AMD-G4]|nr:MAG: hypothetical protein CAK90_04475 [Spartobacteria bacterium AMD-G4]
MQFQESLSSQEAQRKVCVGCFGRVCESGGENFQLSAQTLEKLGVKVVLETMPTAAMFLLMAGALRWVIVASRLLGFRNS